MLNLIQFYQKFQLKDVFIDLVRFSREVDEKVPVQKAPVYKLAKDRVFGLIPVYLPAQRELFRALPILLRWTMTPANVKPRTYSSVEEAHNEALKFFGHLAQPEHSEPQEKHLSDEWLHYMITSKLAFMLKPTVNKTQNETEETFELDLEFMQQLPVAKGYERHGGKVTVSRSHLLSVTHHGITYFPSDPKWELVKYKFRVCAFAWATLLHTTYHMREGAKLFLATHRCISKTHPLHQLFLPYHYGVHKNIARLQRTVIGTKGVISMVGGFSSGPEALEFILNRAGIDLPHETKVTWPQHHHDTLALWKIFHKHVSDYLDYFKISERSDAQVKDWLQYVGTNIHPRLFTSTLSDQSDLNLADVVTYLLFNVSVTHYSLGHTFNGTTDPRYICGTVRVSNDNNIWSLVSTRDECLIRYAVYATINRHAYRITEDFSSHCTDPNAQEMIRNFARELRRFSDQVEKDNRNKPFPRLLVPDKITTSSIL